MPSLSYTDFLRSLIHILEAKKMYFPRFVYCLMIVIMYCQYAGYVFCTYESKPLIDRKIIFFAHWNEYSTGTFLLYVASNDSLTLIFFWLFEAMLYCYFIYIVVLALLDHYKSNFTIRFHFIFDILNNFYQFFFSSFLWIFYAPFTEIHSGIIVCSHNSFLVNYRSQDCSTKPAYFFILGSLGLFLTFLTGAVLLYFYVNYEFLEKNYLKRQFQPNLFLQLIARTLLIFLYYLDIANITIVKHIVSHLLGLISCYDFLRHLPFRDQFICTFYGYVTFVYEYSIILFSFWELTSFLEEFNIFFVWIMGSSFIVVFIKLYVKNYYWQSLLLLPGGLNESKLETIDIFLEQLMVLTFNSEWDKKAKLQIQGVIERMQKKIPSNLNFFKKKVDLKSILVENQQIDSNKIVIIINELFRIFLKDPILRNSKTTYEYISLKYCSFLGSYQNNPIKAYYELKSLLNLNSQVSSSLIHNIKYKPSIIFLIISKVISKNIENLLIKTFEIKYEMEIIVGNSEKSLKNIWKTLPKSEEYKLKYVKKMAEIGKFKVKFFESLCLGYNRMDDFLKDSLYLMKKIENFNKDFFGSLQENNLPDLAKNVIYLKLMSLYKLMILNDNIGARIFEEKLKEIKKIDAGLKEGCVNSLSILSGNSIVLQISLLREKGRIINQKTERMAHFFGYDFQDFKALNSINSLMPDAFSKNHNAFLNRFIKHGPTSHFTEEKTVFGIGNQGFIFPLYKNMNMTFVTQEDFVISGVLTKAEKSSLIFLFNEKGDILGVSDALVNEMNEIQEENSKFTRNEILQIYENFNIFWFLPELIEQMPSNETIIKSIEKKEQFLEAIINGRVSIYFPKNFGKILELIKKYRRKNEQILNNLKNYEDLFQKEIKIVLKKFCYFMNTKQNLKKQLARYSLRYEMNYTSKKKYMSVFILTIHEFYQIDNFQDLDFLSYSIEKTNTTQTSQQTFLTLRSETPDMKVFLKNEFIPKKNTEGLILNINDLPRDGATAENEATYNKKLQEIALKEEEDQKKIEFKEPEDKSDKSEKISEELEKNESKQGNQFDMPRQSSLNSTKSAGLTNKGLFFITSFIKNGRISGLMKKIFLIMSFQILVFFLIDIIYIILIKSKFDEYYTSLQETIKPALLMNFYSQSLFAANTFQLGNEGIFLNSDIEINHEYLDDLLNQSFKGLQNAFTSDTLFVNDLYEEKIIVKCINNDFNNGSSSQNIPLVTFNQKIQSLIFGVIINHKDYLNYSELRVNFLAFYKEISKISNTLLSQLKDNKDSFIAFYIYLTITGIISALLLQLISFPFFKKYYKYLEKMLILITRLQEKECDLELYKFKHFLHFLESTDESYMMTGLKKLEGEKQIARTYKTKMNKTKDKTDYQRKVKASKKSNYLTSRISSQQLNMRSFRLSLFLSFLLVFGYYGGAFLFLFEISNYLEYSNKIMKFSNTFALHLNVINLSKRFLISSSFVKDREVLVENDILNFKLIFNDSLYQLKKELNIHIDIPNNQIPDKYILNMKNVLNEDSCEFEFNKNDCKNLKINGFKEGIREYLIAFLNTMLLMKEEIMNPENLTLTEVKKLLLIETTLLEDIATYRIMGKILNFLTIESTKSTEEILNALYNKLFILFVVGGILCSVTWWVLALFRMKMIWNEVNLSKKLLIMIPINKLNEESTLHLMRNLDNI